MIALKRQPLLDKSLPENIPFNGRRILLQYYVELQISHFDEEAQDPG
jgi:hypothetical protein